MNRAVRWGVTLALLPLAAACSSNRPPAPMASATPPAPPPLSSQDASFVTMAEQGNLAEIQEGQLAATQAMRPAVKQFGQRMVDEHTPVSQQLATLGQQKGATVPTAPSDAQTAMFNKIQALHGRRFDVAYLHDQVAGHEMMVQILQNEIQNGTDPDLKAFAQQVLPTVQQHLADAL